MEESFREKIQRHRDAETCYLCGNHVEDGTPIHGLTGAHWSCVEKLQSIFADLPSRDDPPKTLHPEGLRYFMAIAKGGHRVHIVDSETQTSLCGHKPKNGKLRVQRGRAGWRLLKDDIQNFHIMCPHCIEIGRKE
jgi:hypothetical protein